jgi:DNA-binding MarR family transcriptional regulator
VDPLIWLELALAAIGGVVVGWFAHLLIRGRSSQEAEPQREPVTSWSGAVEPALVARPEAINSAAPAPIPPQVSEDADLAGRVIRHLASLGRLGNDEVGRLGFTQRGMIDALGIRQGTLTKVLSRLEAAQVIEVDRRHVQGQPRRLNVYRLTALGESVARDIRHPRRSMATGAETSADVRS